MSLPFQVSDYGLFCGARSLPELTSIISHARALGFDTVMFGAQWAPYESEQFEEIARVLEHHQLRCPVVGVYSDLLRPERKLKGFNTGGEELDFLLPWMKRFGADRLVVWAGSTGEDFESPEVSQRDPEVMRRLDENMERLRPELRKYGVRLLLEPWRKHVLGDEDVTADFCRRHAPDVGVVVDVPNFIQASQWPDQWNGRMRKIISTLAPYAGCVHLKGFRMSGAMPSLAEGDLDLAEHLRALSPLRGRVPFIVEHLKVPDEVPPVIEALRRAHEVL